MTEEYASDSQIKLMGNLGMVFAGRPTKKEASVMIKEALARKKEQMEAKVERVEPEVIGVEAFKQKTTSNFNAMYVSYAKDIFIALMQHEKYRNLAPYQVMQEAVKLVEGARAELK